MTARLSPKIVGLVLAAGKSTRMGTNKLLADLGGKPLIWHCVEALKASNLESVIVVTGNEAKEVKSALERLVVSFVHNPQFAEGLSTSLKCGVGAVPDTADGILVCLGDMPLVDAALVNRLIAAFDPMKHHSICVPTFGGVRGNPVLWGRQHFAALSQLAGDQGGKQLMGVVADKIAEVGATSNGILLDADTPGQLEKIRSILKP